MQRGNLQIALLSVLVAALLLTSGICAFLVYSDNPRFVAACLQVRTKPTEGAPAEPASTVAQPPEVRQCLRDMASAVANTIGTAFGPLLVIMLSVIFMHKTTKEDVLDRRHSVIALVMFCSLQAVAVGILTFTVALTENLLDLRPDALQNAIFTAIQGIVVAFVFPRGGDSGPQPG